MCSLGVDLKRVVVIKLFWIQEWITHNHDCSRFNYIRLRSGRVVDTMWKLIVGATFSGKTSGSMPVVIGRGPSG